MKIVDIADMPVEQWRPGVETRMVVSAATGAAELCIFEQWVAPGNGAPTHSHPVEEVLTVSDEQIEEAPGADPAMIEAIVRIDDRLIVLLTLGTVFATNPDAPVAA